MCTVTAIVFIGLISATEHNPYCLVLRCDSIETFSEDISARENARIVVLVPPVFDFIWDQGFKSRLCF